MKTPRARPGARPRAELELPATPGTPVEIKSKLRDVLGGRWKPPQLMPVTHCRRVGPPVPGVTTVWRRSGLRSPMLGARAVTDLTTSAILSRKREEQLETWTRVATTSVRGTIFCDDFRNVYRNL